jgi:hypothetical protein
MGHGHTGDQERKIHFVGLNVRANDLLRTGYRSCIERGIRTWADTGVEEAFEREVKVPPMVTQYKPFLNIEGSCAESFFLSHEFANGRVLREDLQADHIANRRGRPIDSMQTVHFCVFVALKEEREHSETLTDPDGNETKRVWRQWDWIEETLWTKEEMEREFDRFR